MDVSLSSESTRPDQQGAEMSPFFSLPLDLLILLHCQLSLISIFSHEAFPAAGLLVRVGIVCTAIYRLCFHPLAKNPGPKLEALTFCCEIYYNLVKPGNFIWEIKRTCMHEAYGMSPRKPPETSITLSSLTAFQGSQVLGRIFLGRI